MFDNLAFWLFPESIQEDDPVESAARMRDAGATHVFAYLSNPAPEHENLPHAERQERLGRLINACHQARLEVHGCFCEMKFTGQAAAWHQCREDGTRGALLCPANPEVASWVLERLRTFLARCPLDGINLEDSYIYQSTAVYDPANASAAAYRTIEVCSCDYCREHAPKAPDERQAFKEDAVTALVKRIRAQCRESGLDVMSAAARLPYDRDFYSAWRDEIPYWDGWAHCQARRNFCADWAGWHAQGLLDFVCPMSYLHDTRIVQLHTEEARSRVREPDRNVWMGLGLSYITAEWMEKKKPEYLNDADNIRKQLEMLSALGQRNVVFFAYKQDWVTDEHIEVMAAAKAT